MKKQPTLHLAKVPTDPKALMKMCEKLARDIRGREPTPKEPNEKSPDRLE
jgi:hypothetical protein